MAYAGLRRGELRALRWADVDLDAGVIHVRRSWDDDPEVGEIDVKSDAGRRRVPLVGALRDLIVEHGLLSRARGTGWSQTGTSASWYYGSPGDYGAFGVPGGAAGNGLVNALMTRRIRLDREVAVRYPARAPSTATIR